MEKIKQCSLCEKEAEDSIEVECGNNAEYSIELNLCRDHLNEEEKIGYKFNEKYGSKIEDLNNQRWC